MEFVKFIGQDFPHWFGFVIILIIVISPFIVNKESESNDNGEL